MSKTLIASRDSLTQSLLQSLVRYDPLTGEFTWLCQRGPKRTGDMAGSEATGGYWVITIDFIPYRANRLAWLYMTGHWPTNDIDHRDKNPLNDIWTNLREATAAQNAQNKRPRKSSRSGLLGVSWITAKQRWRASICVNGKHHVLGSGFHTAEEAAKAYIEAKPRFHTFNPDVSADEPVCAGRSV